MTNIIAHRFFSNDNLENSMAAIKLAIKKNAWAVETDIQLTCDNVPVLMHDKLLDRTTNSRGYLKNWSYSELKDSCLLVNDEKIPSLEELFCLIGMKDIKLYLEIIDPNALEAVLKLVEQYGLSSQVIISSFHHDVLVKTKRINSSQRTMALFECNPIDPVSLVKSARAEEAGVGFESISYDLVRKLNLSGVDTYAWTVNDSVELALAKDYGLTGVFTDRSDL